MLTGNIQKQIEYYSKIVLGEHNEYPQAFTENKTPTLGECSLAKSSVLLLDNGFYALHEYKNNVRVYTKGIDTKIETISQQGDEISFKFNDAYTESIKIPADRHVIALDVESECWLIIGPHKPRKGQIEHPCKIGS